MFDVRRLRVLREVARHGSFSAAAFEMSYTPSAISQQIAALEREVGTVLMERSVRGVRLTQAGELVLGHAEAVLERLERAEDELRALLEVRGGQLRVAAFHSAAATVVPAVMGSFRQRHPEVEVSLVETHPDDAIARLRAGVIDLVLVFNYDILTIVDDEQLTTVRLFEDPVHLALPATHPCARRPATGLAELREEAWIQTVTPSCSHFLTLAARRAGFEPRIAFEADVYEAVLGLVAAGVGVALVPELALDSVPDGVAIRPIIEPSPMRYIDAVLPLAPAPAAVAFLEALRDESSRRARVAGQEVRALPVAG